MKKCNPILGVICLLILGGIVGYVFFAGAAKAEIIIDGKTYEMRNVTVEADMGDGYVFSTISTEEDGV